MSPQTPSPDEARELAKRLDAMLTGRPRFHDDQALMEAVLALRSLAREVEALRRVEDAARVVAPYVRDRLAVPLAARKALTAALSALNTEEPRDAPVKPE